MNNIINIIIVDDEIEALNHFLGQIIDKTDINYKFFNTISAQDILEYAKSNTIDCAYLDIRMPQIDGVTLAKKLIEIIPTIKIVFITGFTFDENKIRKELNDSLLDFVYKPFDPEKIQKTILSLKNNKITIYFHTFGYFTCFINNISIHFLSNKSKELLALLAINKGKEITMNEVISKLWKDRDIDLAKRLYRDSVYKLRNKLNEYGIGNILITRRGSLQLDLNQHNISCDYWDYLNGDTKYYNEFLTDYEWALNIKAKLDSEN